MSQTELHVGKLQKIENNKNLPIEELCKLLCEVNKYELQSFHNNFVDALSDCGRKKFFVYENDAYFFVEHIEKEDMDYFMHLSENSDGTINFVGSFYNGGTYFEEMLTEALDKKFKKIK